MDRLHGLCQTALTKFPLTTQFDHLLEEMAELQLAMARLWRKRSTDDDVLEEIVDVFMCSVEMGVHHYGPERFNAMLAKKVEKFATGLATSEPEDGA